MFCPDDSARVMHYGSFGLKVYEISKEYSGTHKLEETYFLNCDNEKSSDMSAFPVVTRTGRQVKRPQNYQDDESDTVTNVTFQYEDELSLFGILISSETINDDDSQANSLMTHVKEVKILDRSFTPLYTEKLDIISVRSAMDCSGSVSVTLDQDLLMVTVKNSSKTTLHTYKLRSIDEKTNQ